MVRHYKRKPRSRQYRNYSDEQIQQALDAIKKGMSNGEGARHSESRTPHFLIKSTVGTWESPGIHLCWKK